MTWLVPKKRLREIPEMIVRMSQTEAGEAEADEERARSQMHKIGACNQTQTLSGVLSLVFLHLHTKFFYRLQVSRTAPPTAPRFFPPCMPHLTLTPLTQTK
jgi:hypothetical protein